MSITRLDPRRRHTYAGEEEWFGLLDEVGHRSLRHGFIAAGVSPTIAGNLVFWLEDQKLLDRHYGTKSGVRYRRVLEQLDIDEVARAARTIPG